MFQKQSHMENTCNKDVTTDSGNSNFFLLPPSPQLQVSPCELGIVKRKK